MSHPEQWDLFEQSVTSMPDGFVDGLIDQTRNKAHEVVLPVQNHKHLVQPKLWVVYQERGITMTLVASKTINPRKSSREFIFDVKKEVKVRWKWTIIVETKYKFLADASFGVRTIPADKHDISEKRNEKVDPHTGEVTDVFIPTIPNVPNREILLVLCTTARKLMYDLWYTDEVVKG